MAIQGGKMRSSEQQAEQSLRASWRRYVRRYVAGCAIGFAATYALAALPASAATPGTSSRAAKEEAVAEIPFDRIKADVRGKLLDVLEKPSLYRRLPDKTIACDPDMYLFLVRNPEVVVNIWELMGVTNVKLKRVGEYTFECADGAGTVGTVELVYGTHDLHVLYAEATYEGALTGRKLNGRGVMLLRSEYKKDKEERVLVQNSLDVFIQIDQTGAELVAKTLQPLVGKAADINFQESATFVGRVSQAAESNAAGMQRLAAKLKNVTPERRAEFADISAVVSERAVLRQADVADQRSQTGAPPSAKARPAAPQMRR
jgi:hypothetical protein